MGLLTDIEAAAASARRGPHCKTGQVLASLPPDDSADLAAALADSRYETNTIARVLTARGIRVAPVSIGRHRRGDCQCPRS